LGLSITGRKAKKPNDPLTDAEADRLLERARPYRDGEFYLLFLTALRTGMRIGEITALKWQDVDFDNRLIEVQRSIMRGVISSTKNHKTRRVDISPQLAEELALWRTRQKRLALEHQYSVPEFIFTDTAGQTYRNHKIRSALSKCLKDAGLRQIRIHDLRHTYASIRLLRGHNIGDVSYQLGHSSIKITYDVYGHWQPGKFKAEVDDLDNPHQSAPQARLNESEF
jgi:integrase